MSFPFIHPSVVSAINATTDLTSGTIYRIFGLPRPTHIDWINVLPIGANVATNMKLWINNGGDTTKAANNSPVSDLDIPLGSSAVGVHQFECDFDLESGYRLYVTLGTGVAAGFRVVVFYT